MSDQPEALRLADELEVRGFLGTTAWEAAVELRRLHGEVERLRAELAAAYAEIRKQVAGSKVVFDRELVERAKGQTK